MKDLKHLAYFENLLLNADNELIRARPGGKARYAWRMYARIRRSLC